MTPRELLDLITELNGKGRVRLCALRLCCSDLSRSELDSLLLDMQDDGLVVLSRLDNPVEITAHDREAALMIAGNPRHLVFAL